MSVTSNLILHFTCKLTGNSFPIPYLTPAVRIANFLIVQAGLHCGNLFSVVPHTCPELHAIRCKLNVGDYKAKTLDLKPETQNLRLKTD